MSQAVEFLRVLLVIALVCVAGALATPKGRLPLALRGVLKIMRKDCGAIAPAESRAAPTWKRLAAFALVVLAAFLCLVRL